MAKVFIDFSMIFILVNYKTAVIKATNKESDKDKYAGTIIVHKKNPPDSYETVISAKPSKPPS